MSDHFNSEAVENAIHILEWRLKQHRKCEELTPEELLTRRQLYDALHKLQAVRKGLAVRRPDRYLH